MELNVINNLNNQQIESYFWQYVKSEEDNSKYFLSMLLGRKEISDDVILEGFQYLWSLPSSHLKFSKMGVLSRHKYLLENQAFLIITESSINEIYNFYLEKLQNQISFISGDQNLWQIVSLLKLLKHISPDKIRSISEIISYSYGYFRKIDPQKILENVYKVLEFSKYY